MLCLLILLGGCSAAQPAPLDQQVYVWQRQWRAEHAQALQQSRAGFSTLRVLALQAHPSEGWSRSRIDSGLLKSDGRPLIAVVRLDGQLPQLDQQRAGQEIQQMLADWRAAGLQPIGVEIDHDCATARLPAYAAFLVELRRQLPPELQLSITALPAWLESAALPTLLAAVDGSVLQVHAVVAPDKGLFDPGQALDWARRWSGRSSTPFLLALPAYSLGLVTDEAGDWQVESEVPLAVAGPRQELSADPQQLAALVQTLRHDPPPHLTGLIWFRLPLDGDRRAWPLATLQAVTKGEPLRAQLRLEATGEGPLYEFHLVNRGTLAGALPQRMQVAAGNCQAGDALAGYQLRRDAAGLAWSRQTPRQLQAGRRLAVGWARCESLDRGILDAAF